MATRGGSGGRVDHARRHDDGCNWRHIRVSEQLHAGGSMHIRSENILEVFDFL